MPATMFEAVLGNLALAAALAVLAFAAGRWLKRPAVAHVLWLLVLVKLVTPPLFTVPLRILPAREVAEGPDLPLPRPVIVTVPVVTTAAIAKPVAVTPPVERQTA